MADFTLPELGENVTAGDVLRVLVKPGDTVTKDQTVLELETDKATIEVPSSVAGRVTAVSVKAGDKVKVGQVVLSVEDGAGKPPQPAPAPEKAASAGQRNRKGVERRAKTGRRAPTRRTRPEGGLDQHVEGPKRAAARRTWSGSGRRRAGEKKQAEAADRP